MTRKAPARSPRSIAPGDVGDLAAPDEISDPVAHPGRDDDYIALGFEQRPGLALRFPSSAGHDATPAGQLERDGVAEGHEPTVGAVGESAVPVLLQPRELVLSARTARPGERETVFTRLTQRHNARETGSAYVRLNGCRQDSRDRRPGHGRLQTAGVPRRERGNGDVAHHRLRRGAAGRLRPRQPVDVLHRTHRRGSVARRSRGPRASGHRVHSRRPGHQPRPEGAHGDRRLRTGCRLRQPGAGHRVVPVRPAHSRQRWSGQVRVPHDRGSRCHPGLCRRLRHRCRHRRRAPRPRSGRSPAGPGPPDPHRRIRPPPHGHPGRRRRRRHPAPHHRSDGHRRPHVEVDDRDRSGRRLGSGRGPCLRRRRVAGHRHGRLLGRDPAPRRTGPGRRSRARRARRRAHRRRLSQLRSEHLRHRRMRRGGGPHLRPGQPGLRPGPGGGRPAGRRQRHLRRRRHVDQAEAPRRRRGQLRRCPRQHRGLP